MPKSELLIREARPEDKPHVLTFVRRTWRWGDYIPKVWDEWFNEPHGRILVAVLDGEVVGMNHVRFSTPNYAWLEGARVHPKHRRKGVATALALNALEFSSASGARIARLATSSNNEPAKAHLMKLGFRVEAEFVWLQGTPPIESHAVKIREAERSELGSLWLEIKRSAVYKASAGLIGRGWAWYEMNRQTLSEYANQGGLFLASTGLKRTGIALLGSAKGENVIEVAYIDGVQAAVKSLLSLSSNGYRRTSSKRVRIFAPKHQLLLATLLKVGLKEKGKYLVFSKQI